MEMHVKRPKNPKTSARKKYNRRKLWAAHALQQLEYHVEDVLKQRGTIYKKNELLKIQAAIEGFWSATGLKSEMELKFLYRFSDEEVDAVGVMLESIVEANTPNAS